MIHLMKTESTTAALETRQEPALGDQLPVALTTSYLDSKGPTRQLELDEGIYSKFCVMVTVSNTVRMLISNLIN